MVASTRAWNKMRSRANQRISTATVMAGLLVASAHAAAQPTPVKSHSSPGRPLYQCVGSRHVVGAHRRGPDGIETWNEICGKQIARCWIENGQTLCAENFLSAPPEHTSAPPSGTLDAPNSRAPTPATKVAPPTVFHPPAAAVLFDFDRAVVGDITVTRDQEVDRVAIPTEMPATATCEISAGLVDGFRLQRLASHVGKPVVSAALAAADFDSRQDAPRLLFDVVGSDARGSSALRLRVWEHQTHSVACAYDPRPELAPALETAIERFVSGIRWKSPLVAPSKSELRIASLISPDVARSASGSPTIKPSTLARIEWRREVSVPATHERTTEQLLVFLTPGADLTHLSVELRTETADAAGRLEVASVQQGTQPTATRRSARWGVPNREGSCVGSVDGLAMLQKCSRYRGIPTTAQTEERLRKALQAGAFRFEQDELPAIAHAFGRALNTGHVGPYEIVRVAYQRKLEDEPGLVGVSESTGATRLLKLDANGRVVREPIAALASEVAWAPAPARDGGR